MKSSLILTVPLALVVLASCMGSPSECAGWKRVTISEKTLDYLAANDPQALAEMTAHSEYGKRIGCWK